jgi:hypothetical protein
VRVVFTDVTSIPAITSLSDSFALSLVVEECLGVQAMDIKVNQNLTLILLTGRDCHSIENW